jgi:hypothetical protein
MSLPIFTKVMRDNLKRVPPNEAIKPATMDMSMSNSPMYPNKAGLERFLTVKSNPQPPEQHCVPLHPREKRALITEQYRFPFF